MPVQQALCTRVSSLALGVAFSLEITARQVWVAQGAEAELGVLGYLEL